MSCAALCRRGKPILCKYIQRSIYTASGYKEFDKLENSLRKHPVQKWGFVVYRGTYTDDAKWRQFMDFMNLRMRVILQEEGRSYLMNQLDWSVQEDPSLDQATTSQVRDRFKEWVSREFPKEFTSTATQSEAHMRQAMAAHARYQFCIYVDFESLQSVLEGMKQYDAANAWSDFPGYVIVIQKDWRKPSLEELDEETREQEDPWDENEVELEGCKMYDVGWSKCWLWNVMPISYVYLNNFHWDIMYKRPSDGIQDRY